MKKHKGLKISLIEMCIRDRHGALDYMAKGTKGMD